MWIAERAQSRPETTLRIAAEPIGEELDGLGRLAVVPPTREGLQVTEEPLGAPRFVPEATAPPPLVGIEPPHALSYEADGEFFLAGRAWLRSKAGGTWSRELQVSRGAGHGLVFSGGRFYLTDEDRILAR